MLGKHRQSGWTNAPFLLVLALLLLGQLCAPPPPPPPGAQQVTLSYGVEPVFIGTAEAVGCPGASATVFTITVNAVLTPGNAAPVNTGITFVRAPEFTAGTNPATLAGGANTITGTFTPQAPGPRTGSLQLAVQAPAVAGRQSVTFFGLGRCAGQDTDGDGIADAVEDANGNGAADAGETDKRSEDSDGDGVFDGFEDGNQDGVRDPGETSATAARPTPTIPTPTVTGSTTATRMRIRTAKPTLTNRIRDALTPIATASPTT